MTELLVDKLAPATDLVIDTQGDRIRVSSPWWTVEHDGARGGAWTSIVFTHGSGANLLRAPVSSMVRYAFADPASDGRWTFYHERNERAAAMSVERSAEGHPVVVAQGTYRDDAGVATGVRFRRTTEYRPFGLVHTTLDVIGDPGSDDIVEVRVLDLALRAGMTDALVRPHPSQLGGDLLGWGKWHGLAKATGTIFQASTVPQYLICFERGVEGIEIFPPSELHGWDRGLKPDIGLGLHLVEHGADGTSITMSPHCLAYRRLPTSVRGTTSFGLRIGLPNIKPRERVGSTVFHLTASSSWPTDEELASQAAAGVRLVRFHNDYREDGPFWHDGMYPPYDPAGMTELRRVVATSHRLGMRIVPYISLKEFHPESAGYVEHAHEWMHMAAPSVGIVHTWMGSGEFGGLMCLRSGWNEFRKRSIDRILTDIPWDGLYFDWTTPHPCRHPDHARGDYHTDADEFQDLLLWCRRRVGAEGILFMHLSGTPSIVAENMSDLVFVNEDNYGPGTAYRPGEAPPQCDFIPIAPRHLIGAFAMADVVSGFSQTPDGHRAHGIIMGGFLQGYPCNTDTSSSFAKVAIEEIRLFVGEDLSTYDFHRASDRPVITGHDDVFAAAWSRGDAALIYVANYASAERTGALRFPGASAITSSRLACRLRRPSEPERQLQPLATDTVARGSGIAYTLGAWSSALFLLRHAQG
ncbi:MAG: hypothetical protein H0W83_02855 [Planctomycetes bacterium]|nr:hypothetical protein [Planctomycetota bacterium]